MADTGRHTAAQSENGNTKHSRVASIPERRYRNWCFTYWDCGTDGYTKLKNLIDQAEYFGAQMEYTKKGIPHWQGSIMFKHGRTRTALKKKLPGAHLEDMRNEEGSWNYVQKVDSRACNSEFPDLYKLPPPPYVVKDPLAGKEYYWWQQDLIDLFKTEADDRTIHWYWEPTGLRGKSAFLKHCYLTLSGVALAYNKAENVTYIIQQMIEEQKTYPEIVLINLPRGGRVNYNLLEELKDGLFIAGKYKSSPIAMNPPHIVVFANWPPCETRLSADRWHIVDLSASGGGAPPERSAPPRS